MLYLSLLKYVVMLGLLVAVGLWQRHDGALSERVVWETRLAEENANNAKAILAAEEAARQKITESETRQAVISKDYQRKLANARTKYKSVDDAVASGTFQLRDSGATAVCPSSGGSPETTTSTGGNNGAEGCKLSTNTSRSLWFLVTNADSVVEQLTACQALVEADRK
jgi:type II secretory pathway component GspD/PulD (secretin)